ncbi:hypothetical protein DFH09DRAFT_508344 [Mycena vulgaris]|nr:hypothetical protein DFH09DRAFT_508344 [Mycena vulgaris]
MPWLVVSPVSRHTTLLYLRVVCHRIRHSVLRPLPYPPVSRRISAFGRISMSSSGLFPVRFRPHFRYLGRDEGRAGMIFLHTMIAVKYPSQTRGALTALPSKLGFAYPREEEEEKDCSGKGGRSMRPGREREQRRAQTVHILHYALVSACIIGISP